MIWLFLWIIGLLYITLIYIGWVFFYDERKWRKKAPYVDSYWSHRRLLLQYREKLRGESILDMWCGDGAILRLFIKELRYKKGVGYDIRRFPIWLGSIVNKIFLYKDITLYQQDFHNADLWDYDMIYLFLWSDVIIKLEKRIHESIRPGTIVITNTFHFADREPFDVIRNQKGKVVFQLYKKVNSL